MPVERARPRRAAVHRCRTGAQPAAHRVARHPEAPRDAADRHTLAPPARHLVIARRPPLAPRGAVRLASQPVARLSPIAARRRAACRAGRLHAAATQPAQHASPILRRTPNPQPTRTTRGRYPLPPYGGEAIKRNCSTSEPSSFDSTRARPQHVALLAAAEAQDRADALSLEVIVTAHDSHTRSLLTCYPNDTGDAAARFDAAFRSAITKRT